MFNVDLIVKKLFDVAVNFNDEQNAHIARSHPISRDKAALNTHILLDLCACASTVVDTESLQ